MDNNLNNAGASEEQASGHKGGYKKNHHYNKNKRRFEGNGQEERRTDKGFEKKPEKNNEKENDKQADKTGTKGFGKSHKNNNYKKHTEYKGKNHGEGYRKFDSRKRHKEYRRSENDIDLVKAQKLGAFEDESEFLVEVEAIVEKEAQKVEAVVETVEIKAEPESVAEETEVKPENEVRTKETNNHFQKSNRNSAYNMDYNNRDRIFINEFNLEKDYGAYRPSNNKVKREEFSGPKQEIEVIGVRFRQTGKIYYFSRGKFDVKANDYVIVETARGVEYGKVVLSPRMVEDKPIYQPLKTIIRVATEEDHETEKANKIKEKEALAICHEKVRLHQLDMKLIDCEYTFDNNKVLFYFTADGRIDFRELVKDLAAVFRTRIELRQIGVRDETKIVGGIGTCGRPLCCHSYLSDFIPVSIKMAKEQNLSLNPTKISGVCGRLMCCLKNEEDWYEEANMKLPYKGDMVETNDGFKGEVHSVNAMKGLVRVIISLENDEREAREYHVDDLKFQRRKRYDNLAIDDELRKLEMLEKHDIKSNLEDK